MAETHSSESEKGSAGRQFLVSSVKWKIFIPLTFFTFSWNCSAESDFLRRTGLSSGQSSAALQQAARVQALRMKIAHFHRLVKRPFNVA